MAVLIHPWSGVVQPGHYSLGSVTHFIREHPGLVGGGVRTKVVCNQKEATIIVKAYIDPIGTALDPNNGCLDVKGGRQDGIGHVISSSVCQSSQCAADTKNVAFAVAVIPASRTTSP